MTEKALTASILIICAIAAIAIMGEGQRQNKENKEIDDLQTKALIADYREYMKVAESGTAQMKVNEQVNKALTTQQSKIDDLYRIQNKPTANAYCTIKNQEENILLNCKELP